MTSLRLMITDIIDRGCLSTFKYGGMSRPEPVRVGRPQAESQADCFGPEEGRLLKMGFR